MSSDAYFVEALDLDLKILRPENRITAKALAVKLKRALESAQRHLVVDVRTHAEFQMCHIAGAVNWPVENLDRPEEFRRLMGLVKDSGCDVTFLCRRGNDSQLVAREVLGSLEDGTMASEDVLAQGTVKQETVSQGTVSQGTVNVKDLTGGLHAWAKDVDVEFPIY